ncbi:uncharacterized protein LOC135216691 isoform X3 [Macrobrachium nipponense]|uniref:uncharacterized protein LOC135216691 isoform X3 n=1 Tax=Macrobrachium nipponense TaxID=159736 RepID=UPI0030C831FE
MGDANKKYMSFWKRHMHRSVSSPSLARKSGKLSKDEISMPFPGDPSCFRPLNSFYGSTESNSNHCRSAEILSDSQGNAKDSILEKGKVSRDAGGKSRSKSINTLLRSQEIYTSEQHHALQARGLQSLGSAPETPKQKQDNVTNSYAPSVSGERAESTDRIDSSNKSVMDSKSCNGSIRPLKENGPDATVEPTRKLPLGSKNREENKKSKLMALGRRSQRQKNINFDTRNTMKSDNDQKTQQEKKKDSKPSIFGISFRRKKKESNTKSHVTIYEVPEKESPDKKSSQSASPGENLLPGGKQDELYGYGSPIYEIMTPTEIYERRASIKNINGASTPKISSSQRRTGNNEDRHFDFDLSKINLKISPEAQNSKQSLKKGDANSCIIDTPDGNKILERSPTVSDSTEDNKSTSITFKSESPEGVKEVVNILPETSSTHSQHTWDSPGGLLPPPELKTQPTPPRKHQHITRTRSEPTKGRGDLSIHRTLTHTQSEAMYPLLDDHLKKHNIRVAAELGIDIPSLSKSDVPAIERARNSRKESDPEFSTPTNTTKRRPASLTLPEYGDTSEQTSQYSSPLQNRFDPIPRSISQTFNLDTAYSTSKQAPLAAGESFSNNGPVPGGQTHYISTKKQVVVKKIGRTGDPRHANRPALQTTGQMVDSTDGPAPRHKGNVQETGTHTNSDIPAAPPPPPIIVGAIRKKQQEFTRGSDLEGINKVNLYPKEGNPQNSEEVRDALPQYDPPFPPKEAKLPPPNETTLSHSKETLPLSNRTTIPLPKETAIPRPREPTLHSHYNDVFEAPTHRMESVIPQRPLYAVGEDLYDIPRYRSHQQPYTQRTLHPSRANAYNVYDNPGRFVPPQPNIPRTQAPSSDRDVAKAAVINWVTDRVAQLPANARAMYVNHQWSCKVQPKLMYRQPPIYEENSEDVYQVYQPRELITAKHYNDPYQFVGIYRSASLERIERPPPPVKSVVYGNAHSQIPHYTVPRRLPYQQRSFHYPPSQQEPNLIYDQYAAFHRSPSLDRQGRRPHAQSSFNLYARPSDLQYARFLSPQKYSSSQPPSPAGFYRTASLDRLGRRNLAVAGPGDPYLPPPRSSHQHHRHPGYYHQQPPMVLQQKAEHQLRYDQHMNGHQSPYADRRQRDPAGGRFRSYSSAAQVMRPQPSPQPPQQNQSHDYQRNYQLPTPI